MRATRFAFAAVAAVALEIGIGGCAGARDAEPLDRSKAPELPEPPAVKLPPIHSKELPNGLRVLMVEHHELPVADFILLVRSGAESDPNEKLGLATLTAAMLDEGAGSRDALGIADQIGLSGAALFTSSGWDASRVSLHTITSEMDSALAVFADVILRPTFPEKEFDRLRKERLTSILQIEDNPAQIADIVFAKVVFGDQNPYGRQMIGTETTVESILAADVAAFYRGHYRPNNSILIAVGDFRTAEMEQKVEQLFGKWERADVARPEFAAPPPRTRSSIYLIDRPGSPQASVRIGHVGTARSTPDYFGLAVANTILGGSFTSRLNMNLREAKAFTYGATSRFDMRRSIGPFSARGEIFTDKADSALIEFMKELKAIQDTVPAPELDKARKYLQLQLPDLFETTGDVAEQLVTVALHDLPLDYYDKYAQSIGAVSQADIKRVTGSHIKPAEVAIVIVGDRRAIEPGLRKLGLGAIEIRDVQGKAAR